MKEVTESEVQEFQTVNSKGQNASVLSIAAAMAICGLVASGCGEFYLGTSNSALSKTSPSDTKSAATLSPLGERIFRALISRKMGVSFNKREYQVVLSDTFPATQTDEGKSTFEFSCGDTISTEEISTEQIDTQIKPLFGELEEQYDAGGIMSTRFESTVGTDTGIEIFYDPRVHQADPGSSASRTGPDGSTTVGWTESNGDRRGLYYDSDGNLAGGWHNTTDDGPNSYGGSTDRSTRTRNGWTTRTTVENGSNGRRRRSTSTRSNGETGQTHTTTTNYDENGRRVSREDCEGEEDCTKEIFEDDDSSDDEEDDGKKICEDCVELPYYVTNPGILDIELSFDTPVDLGALINTEALIHFASSEKECAIPTTGVTNLRIILSYGDSHHAITALGLQ